MELAILDTKSKVALSEDVFNKDFQEGLVHQVASTYLTNARAGTKAQKSRSDVSGGGKKPWRQKGTGRARAGTIRSPLWRSGGVTFAASPKQYDKKVNKKMHKAALRCIFSELVKQERLLVFKTFEVSEPKTSELLKKLTAIKEIDLSKRVLLVLDSLTDNLILASRNLPRVEVATSGQVDPVSLIAANKLIVTEAALKAIEERLL